MSGGGQGSYTGASLHVVYSNGSTADITGDIEGNGGSVHFTVPGVSGATVTSAVAHYNATQEQTNCVVTISHVIEQGTTTTLAEETTTSLEQTTTTSQEETTTTEAQTTTTTVGQTTTTVGEVSSTTTTEAETTTTEAQTTTTVGEVSSTHDHRGQSDDGHRDPDRRRRDGRSGSRGLDHRTVRDRLGWWSRLDRCSFDAEVARARTGVS